MASLADLVVVLSLAAFIIWNSIDELVDSELVV